MFSGSPLPLSNAPPPVKEATRKKAEATLVRVRKGADFSRLASELSEDPGRLRAYRRWGLCAYAYGAHPAHVLGNNLGVPGNVETTLASMRAVEGRRCHFTHLQFHSYGGTLGGPIWPNHSFFFFTYEGLKDRVAEGDSLAIAIRAVASGGSMLDPHIVEALMSPVTAIVAVVPYEMPRSCWSRPSCVHLLASSQSAPR